MKRSNALTGIIPWAFCLTCLIPLLIAAGLGAWAFAAMGTWFSDNGLMVGTAAVTAVAFATVVGLIWVRQSRTAAYDSDVQLLPRAGDKRTWRE